MGFFNFFKRDMGIDLGTANTLIYIADKGIVLNQPSVIAYETRSKKIIAVGEPAKAMIGRAPESVTVVRPLQDGVISDFDMTAAMLSAFIGKALGDGSGTNRLRVVVGVPSGVTEVEKRAVEEVVRQLGAKEVYILEEPMAAAIGAGLSVDDAVGCMICDVGGGTTDIAVIALGGNVTSTSIRYAGDKMNDAVIQYIRKNKGLIIGEKTAEQLKINIGCALMDLDEDGNEVIHRMTASGRDVLTGLPTSVEVTSKDMLIALEESVEIIIEGLKMTLEKTPPEIAADIVTSGLVLTGGGGLLKNLDRMIEIKTGMKVTVAENAFEAVAYGAGKSLSNVEKLKRYSTNSLRR